MSGLTFTGNNGYVKAQFNAAGTTVLANVPGLSFQLAFDGTPFISFRAVLFVNADVTGGYKFALTAPKLTIPAIIFNITTIKSTALQDFTRITALNTAFGNAGTTSLTAIIEGSAQITNNVDAIDPLTVQFAQNVANGTSSILVGSFMNVISYE